MTTKTCEDRVKQYLDGRMEDLRLLWSSYCGEECPHCEGRGQIPSVQKHFHTEDKDCERCNGTGNLDPDEGIPDLGNMYEYGLGFDYVAPGTFTDQQEGYFRYQLSWGGPSDEFRIYADKSGRYAWSVYRIEYWFLDWFDGARRVLGGEDRKLIEEIFSSFFVDSGSADNVYEEALEDY